MSSGFVVETAVSHHFASERERDTESQRQMESERETQRVALAVQLSTMMGSSERVRHTTKTVCRDLESSDASATIELLRKCLPCPSSMQNDIQNNNDAM